MFFKKLWHIKGNFLRELDSAIGYNFAKNRLIFEIFLLHLTDQKFLNLMASQIFFITQNYSRNSWVDQRPGLAKVVEPKWTNRQNSVQHVKLRVMIMQTTI